MWVRCKHWVYLGTFLVIVATIKRPPGITKTIQKPLEIIGNHEKNPRKTGVVLATKIFSGSMGCLGGCILRWFTNV